MEQRRARNIPITLRNPSISVSNIAVNKRVSNLDSRKSIMSSLRRNSSFTMNYQNYDQESAGENLCKAAILVMTKASRNFNENAVLIGYLKTLNPLVKMLKDAVSELNYEDLLKNISFVLKYDYFDENHILFRYGDKGDKFYLILKGQVAILLPKDEKTELSEEEYFLYLLKLRKFKEHEMLLNTINKNKYIYKVDDDDFDEWIRTAIEETDNDDNYDLVKNEKKRNSIYRGASIINPVQKNGLLKKKSFVNNNQDPRFKKTSRVKKLLHKEIEEVYKIIKDKDHITDTAVTVQDYINRLKPELDNNTLLGDRKVVSVWTYNHILSLNDGDKFGDFALDSFSQKRSATIITTQQTHFGTMNKKNYTDCIKDVNEKVKKNNINFVLSLQVFKNGNSHLFMKNYYNFLVLKKVNWREKLCVEGADPENVYFVKEGEFEISMRKSNFMIDEVIKHTRNGDDSHISDTERELSWNDGPNYTRFMSEKKSIRLSIIKNSDVIGLNDAIYKDKYLYNVECVSVKGEVFEMKSKIFKMLCNSDENVKKSTREFEEKKIKNLIDRLLAIRKMRYAFYKSFKNKLIEEEKGKKMNNLEKNSNFEKNLEKIGNLNTSINTHNNGGNSSRVIKNSNTTNAENNDRANTSMSASRIYQTSKEKIVKSSNSNKGVSPYVYANYKEKDKDCTSSTSLLNSRLKMERNLKNLKGKKLSRNKELYIDTGNKDSISASNALSPRSTKNTISILNKYNLPTFEINAHNGEIKKFENSYSTLFNNTNISSSLNQNPHNGNGTGNSFMNNIQNSKLLEKNLTLLKKKILSNSHVIGEGKGDLNGNITTSGTYIATEYSKNNMNNTNTTLTGNNVLSTFYNDANTTGTSRNNNNRDPRDTISSNGKVLKSIMLSTYRDNNKDIPTKSGKDLISIYANGRYQDSNSHTNTRTDAANNIVIDTDRNEANVIDAKEDIPQDTVKDFVTISYEDGSNTFNNTVSTNKEYYTSIFKPKNVNVEKDKEIDLVNNTNGTAFDLYAEIERVSRNFNQTPYKNYSRSLFEKIFQSYMPNSPTNNTSTNINNNTNSPKSKRLISKLINRKAPLEEIFNSESEKTNVVDCLVMDNFNRIYNTIYYYSNVFNPLFPNPEIKNNQRQMSNDNSRSRNVYRGVYKPIRLLQGSEVRKNQKIKFVENKNKLFETSRNLMNDKAKLIFNSKKKVY
jgi:CRP-like cAMP-binding protein